MGANKNKGERYLYGVNHNEMVELVSELNSWCHDVKVGGQDPFVYTTNGLVWIISFNGNDVATPRNKSMAEVKRLCQTVVLKELNKRKR